MPYYHVEVRYYEKIMESMNPESAYELDLSKAELMELIVKPYLEKHDFICGGTIILFSSIIQITITESDEPSTNLISGSRLSDEMRHLILNTRNVTRKFLRHPPSKKGITEKRKKTDQLPSKNIFIVHGRDHKPMKEVKIMLKEFGLNPIVLHEQPSGSRTIVEKLEKYSDVGYAFVILTPDDRGGMYKGEAPLLRAPMLEGSHFRVRQNVILEFGYFMGLLGRDKVCCLLKGDVERPSDIHGIVYIPFKESVNEVKDKIVKELKAAGYEMEI